MTENLLIRAGELITCVNGHRIATAHEDVPFGDDSGQRLIEACEWAIDLPIIGEPAPACSCGEIWCATRRQDVLGPLKLRTVYLHIGAQWRPAPPDGVTLNAALLNEQEAVRNAMAARDREQERVERAKLPRICPGFDVRTIAFKEHPFEPGWQQAYVALAGDAYASIVIDRDMVALLGEENIYNVAIFDVPGGYEPPHDSLDFLSADEVNAMLLGFPGTHVH